MTSSRVKFGRETAHSISLRIGETEILEEHLVSGNESDAVDLNSDGFVIEPSLDILQLSAAQRGIWFAQHLAGSSPISVAQYVEIAGDVNPELLLRACDTACREFGSGYMRLIEIDGEPRQVVDENLESPVSFTDLRGHTDPVATAHRLMVEDYSAPLDMLNDRLMKSVVFQVGSEHFLWYQRAHHIALDGFAAVTMVGRITELYNAWITGEKAPASTAKDLGTIVEQDAAYRDSERFDNDRAYWLDHVAGAPPVAGLAGRVSKPTIHPTLVSAPLSEQTAHLLDRVVAEHGTSVTPVIVAAFAAYLARMTGNDEVLLSLPVSGRHSAVLRRSGGMVANVVPLRVAVAGAHIDDLIQSVQHELTSALRRQRYRQEDIFHDMGIARDEAASFGPAVNLMMVDNEIVLGETTGRLHVLTSGPTADLFVNIYPGAGKGSTHIDFQGNPNVYRSTELAGHHQRFLRFLHAFLDGESGRHIRSLPLLEADERAALLPVRGPAGIAPRLLPDILADGARRDPSATAIAAPGQVVTYRTLDTRSSQLARHLIALGCGPDSAVAVVLHRSVESIIAVWAVAKCGAAIVQVDPEYPVTRIEHMISDSGARVAVTVDANRERLPRTTRHVILDDPALRRACDANADGPVDDDERTRPLRPTNLAYITYTSGSTGVPKGVQVTHTGLANLIADRSHTYGVDATARVSYALSPSFDASLEQFLSCYASGAALVIVPQGVLGGDQLTRLLAEQRVTHVTVTPAMLATMDPEPLTELRAVVVGGDVCPPQVVSRWSEVAAMYNEYGPTEATVTAAGTTISADRALTVGGPVRGVSAMVLDRTLQPVPTGTSGELYLAGPGLARGYSQLFGSTAARFIADPYGEPGSRMYRTGDLARWVDDESQPVDDGSGLALELLGRSDFQVKIRGYRVEPGEIDAALTGHEDVDLCVTVPVRNKADTTVLASYVVAVPGHRVDPVMLERFAREALPPHMVPTVVVPLDSMPVNAFGKLDRSALPAPDFGAAPTSRPPVTQREILLAGLFGEVLGVSNVGADDSFFALGGDSILSIPLVARAKAAGIGVSTQDVFERKTVAALAVTAADTDDSVQLRELPGAGVGPMPLSPIMHAMLDRGYIDRFAQAALVELPEHLQRVELVRALQSVLDRHDMLRAVLRRDEPAERGIDVRARGAVDAETTLLETTLTVRDDTEIDHHLQQAADRLNPGAGVLVQVVWMQDHSGRGPDLMWLVIHHLAIDAVSWRIMLTDLAQAWQQIRDGIDPHPGSATTTVRRWMHGLADAAPHRDPAELDMWKHILTSDDQLFGARRLDPERDTMATAAQVRVRVPATVTEAVLTTIAARFHGSADDPLVTALVLALAQWRRRRGMPAAGELLTMEGHGRTEHAVPGADLSATVGWFTTRYPVRIALSGVDTEDAFAGGDAAGIAIKQVKEQLRAVPDNGIGYGMLRCLDQRGSAELGGSSEPRISFNYLGRVGAREQSGAWAPTTEFTALTATSDPQMALPAVLDINAIAEPGADGLELEATWEFATHILDADDVDELAHLWVQALGGLADHVRSDSAGGFTPSDFPLAPVDQHEIEQWQHSYPSMTDVWPVTALQTGLLFHATYDKADSVDSADGDGAHSDGYTVQAALSLTGQMRPERMRRAAQALIDRHDSLRTAFVESAEGPRQIVVGDASIDWQYCDLTAIGDSDAREREQRRITAAAAAPFDAARPPLVRFHVIRTDIDNYQLLVTNHHIVLDGWSMPVLIHQLLALYAGDGDLADLGPARSYRDYLHWLHTRDHGAALAAWQQVLAGIDSPTRVTAGADPAATTNNGAVDTRLDSATVASITDLGRTHGITVNTSIHVAWALLLASMTGRSDVVFGNTVSDRPPEIAGVEHMVGLFINTLPVRVQLVPQETVADLLVRAQSEQAATLEHRHVGMAELHRAAGVADLFDTVTVLESYPLDAAGLARDLGDAGLRFVDLEAHDATPYPLSLQVTPPRPVHTDVIDANEPDTHTVTLRFATDWFDTDQARTLLDRFQLILAQLAADPGAKVASISACSHAERAALPWGEPVESTAERTLHDLLSSTARQYPDAVAVRSAATELTYRELQHRADRLAGVLVELGARPESLVAVVLPRSVELIVAIWAVAQTGAAFVPLDPDNPYERTEFLLADSGSRLGVTVGSLAPTLPDTVNWLILDGALPHVNAASAEPPRVHNTAYVIYTSGSTGTPKAVQVSHRGLAGLAAAHTAAFGVDSTSRVLHVASPGFDACLSELLLAHGSGACLVVAPPHVYGGDDLTQLLRSQQVSHAIVTPSVLNTMDPAELPRLKTVAVVGEALGSDTVHRWAPRRRLLNHYGPTEATIWATGSPELRPGEPVTIGGPIDGVSVTVLDMWLRQAPAGTAGELFLGGPGLARGYLARPGTTACRFVADPTSSRGERAYRTGDSVRMVPGRDGWELEYLGRTDHQVKIHGQRIEPGEVDAQLLRHPDITSAATVAQQGPTGEPVLVSYVVAAPSAALNVAALHRGLERTLAKSMNPAAIVELDAMPLTTSGKIDRTTLQQNIFQADQEPGRPPATPTEQVIAGLFADVLHVDSVSADSNFFALGGDSIISMQLVALAKAAGFTLTPRDVFDHKTVAALAEAARTEAPTAPIETSPVEGTHDPGRPYRPTDFPLVTLTQSDIGQLEQQYRDLSDIWPLTPMQSGIHFHSTYDPDSADTYTVQTTIGFSGMVDAERLRRAAQTVVDRHDVLRAAFVDTAAGPHEIVLRHVEVDFREIDRTAGNTDTATELGTIAAADAAAGFDLSTPPLIRFTLIRLGAEKCRLLITNHHVILDGWSMPLMLRELLDYYTTPQHSDIDAPAPSYRDYVAWLGEQDFSTSRTAWANEYADVDTPTRVSRTPATAASASGEVTAELSAEHAAQLSGVAAAAAVTVNTALAAAWAMNLRILTGETDVIFGSAVSGRPPQLPRVDQTLGMFLNTIPVRVQLEPTVTLGELLTRIQAQHARMLDHHYLGLPDIHRSIGVSELFDTALAFQSFPLDRHGLQQLVDAAGLNVDDLTGIDATPYPLSMVVAPQQDHGLHITLRFRGDDIDTTRAHHILDRFVHVLTRIATDPDSRLGELILPGEPGPAMPPARDHDNPPATLAGILAASVATTPDAAAVTAGDTTLTYRQLDERSARLARALLRRGVRPGTLVASVLPRSLEATITIWGAAKAGVAFVPIDPNLPAERIEFLLSDSKATLAVTTTTARDALPDNISAHSMDWLLLDRLAEEETLPATVAGAPTTHPHPDTPAGPSHTAYVIYTSGSTGTPKGVQVAHRSLADVAAAQRRTLDVDTTSTVLQVSAPGFDAALFELLMAHGSGGRLVIAPSDVYGGPALADLLRREHVSHAVMTPSALATVPPEGLDELHLLATAGEPVGADLVERWAPHRTMINLYGPTECTIWATASTLEAGAPITIGTPVGPVAAAVLDTWLRPVPEDVTGELYLFGAGIADGYVNTTATTASRFVACPFNEHGQRMYRTGDLVRRNRRGDLEFVGRNDFQVKIRGTRIELGEIDNALAAHPDVAFVVTVPRHDNGRPVTLVSYVVPVAGATTTGAQLRTELADTLPPFMVPSAVLVLDDVPLTSNGKLDRARLPRPVVATREFRPPSSREEVVVAEAFEQILGVRRVGVDDDFFDLGGDSLSASLVVARVGAALDLRVRVRAVFEAPTVVALARHTTSLHRANRVALTAGVRPDPIPLSLAQQRMWFLNRFEPESAAYNIPVMLQLSGHLDTAALGAALDDVIARHEILRTTYPDISGEPHQQVSPQPATTVEPERVPQHSIGDTVDEFVRRGFDITVQAPLRVRLLRVAAADGPDEQFLLVLVVHHIAGDGQSMGPLARDVTTAYAARMHGHAPTWEPLVVQYADYAVWQRQLLGAAEDPTSLLSTQLQFWRSTLAAAPDRLDLPADHARPTVASMTGQRVPFEIEPHLHGRLLELARSRNSSLFMVVHAALAVLLGRLSDNDDVVIGTPVAGRGEPGLDDLVGMFVNTLALRTPVQAGESFTDLLTRTRDTDLQAFEHADVPFERVVEELNPQRSTAQHPLFQVVLAFQNLTNVEIALPDVTVKQADVDTGVSQFDLQFIVADNYTDAGAAQGLSGTMVYATDLFGHATATGFVQRFVRILHAIANNPAAAIGDLDWLATDERRALISRIGDRPTHQNTPLVLPDMLAAAVQKNGGGTAVHGQGTELTYTELDQRSNQLARLLIRNGAGPENPVPVAMTRSVESIIAWWAVSKTGAAYLPVDPRYPGTRIEQMMTDSGATLGITLAAARPGLPDTVNWLVLDHPAGIDDIDDHASAPITDSDRRQPIRATNTAYVVFTSGSTGTPKGAAVTHSGIADYLHAQRANHLGPRSRVLQFASPSFDASLLEIFMAVDSAATLCVAPTHIYGGSELTEFLRTQRITHAFVTPAALASVDPAGLDDLQLVGSGGEEVPADLINRWTGTDHAGTREFRVLYGPTETTIVATAAKQHRPDQRPTIGTPLPGMQALVLDRRLQPVPAGVAGELYLSGPALARGYLNKTATSASRFVACPFAGPGHRMYRTGDLVRWNSQGELEFVGRNDFQVKVRGFRVELGEIDNALRARTDVAFATTISRSDGDGPTTLVSYVVPAAGADLAGTDLRTALGDVLPAYMVPVAVLVLDQIPLTPNGKLDRGALPAPIVHTTGFRAPATPVEEIVAHVFADVLGSTDTIGADDDFFERGGNSLAATRVAARVGAALDTNVPVSMIFEAPTVATLAARAESHTDTGRVALTAQPRPEHIPLSYAQQRMWFLNRFEPDSAAYNIPLILRLSGHLDPDALHAAITDLIARHEILRTIYPHTAGEPAQVVIPATETTTPMPVQSLTESDLAETLSAFVVQPFDLTVEPPLRTRLFELDTDHWVLAVVLHHIGGDGSSLTPLAHDMMTAYTARIRGHAPTWTPQPVQYADYAMWQNAVLGDEHDPTSLLHQHIDHWTTQLADLPALLELPTDRQRPPQQTYAGAQVPITIDAHLHRQLQHIARTHNTTLFMVFHTALAATLARLADTDDIAIGTPYAGRGEPELDTLIGMFVNTLVLRTRPTPDMTFIELLEQVRSTDLAAFGHADVPFERLVQELNPVRSHAHHPLFQVMLAFQNLTGTDFQLPGLSASTLDTDTATSLFDLHITVSDAYDPAGDPTGISGVLTYATDLFDHSTATSIVDRLRRVLHALAAHPADTIGDIDILDPDEHETVLVRSNATDHQLDPDETLTSMFTNTVAENAERPAVTAGTQTFTYAEFAARVNRLARWLISRGVGPESLVALRMPRSLDQVTAMYAVHAAGGGYVPIDPNHPAERIEYILATAAPIVVVDSLPELDPAEFAATPITDTDRIAPLQPHNLAYVLFTSGSTGRPKGVAVPHNAVVNQVRWLQRTYGLNSTDVVLQKTPATFDVSIWELFATLAAGAHMVIARPDGHTDPNYLAETIAAQQVTLTSFVPSMLAAFTDTAPAQQLQSLRALLIAGEAFGAETVTTLRHVLPDIELHNLYGPTEFTVHATAHQVDDTDTGSIPMGTPVWNTRAYVLDRRLHPVPPGVVGELYLAGAQVTRGYQKRPDLTAERFVADPYGTGQRLYRTGDLVRWNQHSELEYLGRIDSQVKLRGLRIELGEIQEVLTEHHTVATAIATVHTTSAGDQLVGYLIPAAGATIDPETIRTHAATELPDYMVPTTLMVLDTMPRTASGKLDRAQLPEPEHTTGEYTEPATWLEGTIAHIFGQVLGVDRVGADDNFYTLGGNSLRSVQVASTLGKELDYAVPLSWMLSDPRPVDLAKRIESGMRSGHNDTEPATFGFDTLLPIRTSGDLPPLFCIHPASGLAWCYRTLDDHLHDDRPIYGIQAPQIGSEETAPNTINDIARRYLDEIRTIQPHGPYHLLGWSLGGIIAHAIAAEIRADGEDVALLALLDSEADSIDPSTVGTVTAGELVSNLGPVIGIDFVPTDATAAQAAELIEQHVGKGTGIDAATIARITDAYNQSIRAASAWEPPLLDSDMLYFTATEDRRADALGPQGWAPVIQGRISNIDIHTTHLAMTEPAATARIAEVLNQQLASNGSAHAPASNDFGKDSASHNPPKATEPNNQQATPSPHSDQRAGASSNGRHRPADRVDEQVRYR